MSYFFCLSAPPQLSQSVLADAFGARARFTQANDCFIAQVARGKYEDWNSQIVWLGSSSYGLIYNESEVLKSALQTILRNENCREVRFLAYLFTGSLRDETFELKRQERLRPETVELAVENIELDVRYAIAKRYFWEEHE